MEIEEIDNKIWDLKAIIASLMAIVKYHKAEIAFLLEKRNTIEEPHKTIWFKYGKDAKKEKDDFGGNF